MGREVDEHQHELAALQDAQQQKMTDVSRRHREELAEYEERIEELEEQIRSGEFGFVFVQFKIKTLKINLRYWKKSSLRSKYAQALLAVFQLVVQSLLHQMAQRLLSFRKPSPHCKTRRMSGRSSWRSFQPGSRRQSRKSCSCSWRKMKSRKRTASCWRITPDCRPPSPSSRRECKNRKRNLCRRLRLTTRSKSCGKAWQVTTLVWVEIQPMFHHILCFP